jgi:hypothetical protein
LLVVAVPLVKLKVVTPDWDRLFRQAFEGGQFCR